MRYSELLEALEDKLEINKSKFVSSFTNIKDTDDIFDQLVKSDPTKNKAYLPWLVNKGLLNWKNKGDSRFKEDLPGLRDILIKYDALKRTNKLRSEHRDVNRIKSEADLWEIVNSYGEQDTRSQKERGHEIDQKFFDDGEAKLLVNNSKYKIIIPLTQKASCHFGVGTKWCTAATSSGNAFNDYNKNGNLYIIIIKGTEEKYQFHLQSGQLMDIRDEEKNFNKFDKKYPDVFGKYIVFSEDEQLIAVKNDGYALKYFKNPNEDIQLAAVKQNGNAIRYIENPSEDIQLAAVNQDGYAIRFIENPSEEVQIAAVNQNGYVIQFIENPSEEVQIAAVNQNGYAIRFIENPTEKVRKLSQSLS